MRRACVEPPPVHHALCVCIVLGISVSTASMCVIWSDHGANCAPLCLFCVCLVCEWLQVCQLLMQQLQHSNRTNMLQSVQVGLRVVQGAVHSACLVCIPLHLPAAQLFCVA